MFFKRSSFFFFGTRSYQIELIFKQINMTHHYNFSMSLDLRVIAIKEGSLTPLQGTQHILNPWFFILSSLKITNLHEVYIVIINILFYKMVNISYQIHSHTYTHCTCVYIDRKIDSFNDFNGMSTCLGKFYVQRLGNCVHFMFIGLMSRVFGNGLWG